MITWAEACASVGYNPDIPGSKIEYVWFAYKAGVGTEFKTEADAKAHSAMVEKVALPESQAAHDKFYNNAVRLENEAAKVWAVALRDKFKDLATDMYHLCYSQAYQEAHAYGYDEVAANMEGIVDFANRVTSLLNDRN